MIAPVIKRSPSVAPIVLKPVFLSSLCTFSIIELDYSQKENKKLVVDIPKKPTSIPPLCGTFPINLHTR